MALRRQQLDSVKQSDQQVQTREANYSCGAIVVHFIVTDI